jgi:hypothetical protein
VIKRIVLDLDDVCNTFTMYVLSRLGCDVGPFDYHCFPSDCGYDILTAYHRLKGESQPHLSKSEFWNSLTREVWATAPQSRELSWLLGMVEFFVGKPNVCLLTSPTIDPECLAGKLEWIHANLPDFLHRQYLVGPPKHFCARPDTLLIDDNDKNCAAFREAGGHAILVPRPWNSRSGWDTQVDIQAGFRLFFPGRF